MDYLGHVVKSGNVELTNLTIDSIRKSLRTTMEAERRSGLGPYNVFRRLVPSFVKFLSPLSNLLRKPQAMEFSPFSKEYIGALEEIKEKLNSSLLLTMPKSIGHYILDTDVYSRQIICVLVQK